MKQNAIETLLAVDNKALQDLHAACGFDFCAPFGVYQIDGRYTVKQIEKIVAEDGFDSYEDVIAVCTRNKLSDWNFDFQLVTIERGNVNIDHKTRYHDKGRGLNHFYTKNNFNEIRKNEDAETIVFAQHKKYIKKQTEKMIDLSARFEFQNFDVYYSPSENKHYINRLHLQRTDASGQKFVYEIIGRTVYSGSFCVESVDQIIDKSGYLLLARRDELKRRAAALRAERKKAAFVATDNTAKIEELQHLIDERQKELVKALETATTAAELKKVYDALSVFNGFISAVGNFERLKENDARKSYDGIDDFTRAYTEIYNALTREE